MENLLGLDRFRLRQNLLFVIEIYSLCSKMLNFKVMIFILYCYFFIMILYKPRVLPYTVMITKSDVTNKKTDKKENDIIVTK